MRFENGGLPPGPGYFWTWAACTVGSIGIVLGSAVWRSAGMI